VAEFELIQTEAGERLSITGAPPRDFVGKPEDDAMICPLSEQNAAALRRALPWTGPVPVGLKKSIGTGDRLGLATPGHISAVKGSGLFPTLAQQSIREMSRSSRTPQDVMDDVTWAVLRVDYRDGFGSDADHLKTVEEIDRTIAAGFVGFTLDPGGYVDNDAHTDGYDALQTKFAALPWDRLDTNPEALKQRYVGGSPVGELTDEVVLRAAAKYGAAVADVVHMARHLTGRMDGQPFDLEVSVDETETPTSPAEHYFIASELMRLGVTFHGLAPRFTGRFEKGVDYIGDLDEFEQSFAVHARLARELGPYKLSIHSGSDKFSIYPIIAKHCGEYVHVKTAGTSWLEALRVVAMQNPSLFREVLAFAIDRYPTDKASYHVSAQLEKIPAEIADGDLPALFDNFDARQVLHVTYGSVLDVYRDALFATLRAHGDAYAQVLKTHFDKHISPFR
jgi:hypothetical protein